MNLYANPALVILGGLAAGILLLAFLAWRVLRSFRSSQTLSDPPPMRLSPFLPLKRPSLLRGFLRGGRFRRSFSRLGARAMLSELASKACSTGNTRAYLLLNLALFGLEDKYRLHSGFPEVDAALATFNATCARTDATGKAVTFRRPGEAPVFDAKSGTVVGFLARGLETEACILAFGNGVKLTRARKVWFTDASPVELADLAAAPSSSFRAVALLLFALLLPAAARAVDYPAAALSQAHHPAIHAGAPICAIGYVESARKERDGDIHVWLCASATKRTMPGRRQGCVLGEIVPSRPLPRPPRGVQIRMCGVWVESDMPHGWTELHPLTEWAVAK